MTRQPRSIVARSLAKYSLVLFLIPLLVTGYFFVQTRPVDPSSSFTTFVIDPGTSVISIANSLKKTGYIKSPFLFRVYVKLSKLSLQAGTYSLSPALTLQEIAHSLTKGKNADVVMTIPEGYRSEQIAETAGLSTKDFLLAAKGLEGELFPDTYNLKKGITSVELVKLMHDNFIKKVGNVDKATLILASLVERETKGDAEKPIVAGILKKRLAADWPLELDATVQYFWGKSGNWWPNTTLLDRKIKSPYNTYLNKGLPPGPIGNPGLASIKAVENSVESPYWFYLHDKNGNIHYGATLEEHNQNIAKYIK